MGDQPEERRQRHGVAAGAGLEELQDGLDLAAQAAPRHGASWPGSAAGRVEADEAFVGGEEEGVHGRQTETKAMIAVAAEEDGPGIGRIRMRRIADASADSLVPFIEDSVAPGSVVHTDGWLGYLPLEGKAYRHEYLSHVNTRLRPNLPKSAGQLRQRNGVGVSGHLFSGTAAMFGRIKVGPEQIARR